MQLNIDEFSSILEKKISDFKSSVDLKEVGEVIFCWRWELPKYTVWTMFKWAR